MRMPQLAFLLAALPVIAVVSPRAAQEPADVSRNKAVARQLFDVALNQDNWDVYLAIHRSDFVAHAGARSADLAQDLEFAKGWRQAFPDGRYSINQMIAEGDLVAVYFTGRGTHTGAGNSLPPGTGKRVEVTGVTILRIIDGKIAEEWNVSDQLSLLRQLGLLPARE